MFLPLYSLEISLCLSFAFTELILFRKRRSGICIRRKSKTIKANMGMGSWIREGFPNYLSSENYKNNLESKNWWWRSLGASMVGAWFHQSYDCSRSLFSLELEGIIFHQQVDQREIKESVIKIYYSHPFLSNALVLLGFLETWAFLFCNNL